METDLTLSATASSAASQPIGQRGRAYATLAVVSALNGAAPGLVAMAQREGLPASVARTFDINVLVWIGCWFGIASMLRDRSGAGLSRTDGVVLAIAALMTLAPAPSLGWLALTGACAFAAASAPADCGLRRGAAVMVCVAMAMFWSRVALALVGDVILAAETALAGYLAGATWSGNVLAAKDGSGFIVMVAACSSLPGVALAILCWVLVVAASRKDRPTRADWIVLAGACATPVVINALRIGFLTRGTSASSLVHGPIAGGAVGWLTTALVVSLCWLCASREMRDHARAAVRI